MSITKETLEAVEAEIVKFQKRIDFYTVDYSIDYLVDRMDQGLFEIPEYQREFLWDRKHQSKFIESLHMGLPVPFFFFWETEKEGRLEIIDGSQRIRTIYSYIKNELPLIGLEKIEKLNGIHFSDLSEQRQRKFKNRAIRGILLNNDVDEDARQMLFDRINTGSLKANPAEIRRGALDGEFMKLIKKLADWEQFFKLAPVSEKAKRQRVNEELVTRFFAYADWLREEGDNTVKYGNSPSDYIFEYTEIMNIHFAKNKKLKTMYAKRFKDMLSFVGNKKVLPHGFTKTPTAKSTPRVRFDAIAVGVDLALEKQPDLISKNISLEEIVNSDEFKKLTTSDAANVKSKIVKRTTYIRDALLEKVNG